MRLVLQLEYWSSQFNFDILIRKDLNITQNAPDNRNQMFACGFPNHHCHPGHVLCGGEEKRNSWGTIAPRVFIVVR